MILYDNLWSVMKARGISQYALIRTYHVSTHTIDMFCRILDCEVGDIMKYVKDQES